MKISELIEELKKLQVENGDLVVVLRDSNGIGRVKYKTLKSSIEIGYATYKDYEAKIIKESSVAYLE